MISEPGRIRTTISIDSEVYDIFRKMAEVTDVSISRCMGNWLAETAEGAQFVTQKMVQVKQAPMDVMRELHVFSDVSELTFKTAVSNAKSKSRTSLPAARQRAGQPADGSYAPSSNTGLKSPAKTVTRRK